MADTHGNDELKTSRRQRHGRPDGRKAFREILEDTRTTSLEHAWERARRASDLRHIAVQTGNYSSARVLSEVKLQAVDRVLELARNEVCLSLDSDLHIGLVSVRLAGRGSLHLPATYRRAGTDRSFREHHDRRRREPVDRPSTPWPAEALAS